MFIEVCSLLAAQTTSGRIPWWVWVILIIILLVLLWFWFGREEEESQAEGVGSRSSEVPKAEVGGVAQAAGAESDDLKMIEGVGLKVATLLNQAGIWTFQQVTDAGAEKLGAILEEAGLKMMDPSTWPEQARLAAAGDWEALKSFQDELKGGKRSL